MTASRWKRWLTAACVAGAALAASAPPAHADPVGLSIPLRNFFHGGRESEPRGPIAYREEWSLAQMRLTLPPTSPDPLPAGASELRFVVNRGSDFGWNQTSRGESPRIRRFLVDAEHQTTEINLRNAINGKLSMGVRVPVQYRGAGFLDGLIDAFHEFTGTATNFREDFFNDRYRIEGFLDDGSTFSWNDSRGWGLGNVEVDAHYAFLDPRSRCDWRAAAIGRVSLPTGTGPMRTGSVDLGLQVVAAKRLANRLDVYLGGGVTYFSDIELRGITYRRWRYSAFLAFEWQVNRCWSLIVDTHFTSRLIEDILRYQEVQWYLNIGGKFDLGENCLLEVGLIENLENQQTTVDVGFHLGLVWRL